MAITDLDEQLLVRAHQAGDEHAFGQIVRSQHRALYAHAHRRLGNHEAAEDAVQDTLLRAYRALPSFDGDLRLRAWLHRILTNVCHDESNRRKRQTGLIHRLEAQPVELAPDPIDEAILHDTVRVMGDAIAELPESYREALVLRYVDGLSFREVADVTGISEENARARVHRARLALHKVLSRVSVMLAFLVPGLRRTQKAIDTGSDSVATGGAEHTVSLSTQLASHVYQAAPMINRVAAEGSSFIAAKSSVAVAAVAVAAAVAAPVAAYHVYDTTKTPERPPAAEAAPADDFKNDQTSPLSVIVPAVDATTSTTSTTVATTTTLPPSAARPFETGAVASDQAADDAAPTTTTTPPTTTPPAQDPGATIEGTIGGMGFDVTGARPDFDVAGPVVLQSGSDGIPGGLSGRVFVADDGSGDAITELNLVLDDGRTFRLRFRGTIEGEEVGDGWKTWTMSGGYSVPGGEAIGLPETGTASVVFREVEAGQSSLSFELQGQQRQ